ncbi:MAG: ABC transporter ATP-binding protein [Planctomycetota bacterium]
MLSATDSNTPIVVCQQLTRIFRDFWMRPRARAVDSLTFQIDKGEVFGLLGPNGSGKSTAIKMILGLLRPTSGRVAIFGKPPTDVATKRRIGYLPEESYLYQFLNARETLEYYAKLFEQDYRTRERRIDELLDMVGLQGAQFRPVREYSKGMQRRIGLAQALINDPEFLVLDEPTTGLDPIGTRQVKDLIIELGRRGKTILLSSHLLADVEDCVSRMIVLYGGQKREEGTCESLLERRERLLIESEPLDDDTIAEIDAVIRRRTGGDRQILSVTRPRQKLEELFLSIVEKARAQQISTSGATHGGETAAFLKSDQSSEIVSRLVAAADEPLQAVAPAPAPAPAAPKGPDVNVLEALTKPAPAPEKDKVAPPPAPPKDFDRSVVDSLLSGNTQNDQQGPKGTNH